MRTRKKATRFPKSKIPTARAMGRHNRHKETPAAKSRIKTSVSVKHPRAFSGFDLWRENIKELELEKKKTETLELIRKRLHDNICKVCADFGYDGQCYSQDPIGCVLNRLLPEIVEAIANVDSMYLKDYLDSVRARVCHECPNEDDQGRCSVRAKADCGLDSYLALVVDVVEDVLREKK